MTPTTDHATRWQSLPYVLAASMALCVAAFATETAARLTHQVLMRLGGELPALTATMISVVQAHVPWMVAMTGAVVLIWLAARASPLTLRGCVLAAVIAALMASLAALALAAPFSLCGDIWPDWVPAARDALDGAGKSNLAISCR